MKPIFKITVIMAITLAAALQVSAKDFTMKNDNIQVTIDENGMLTSLKNVQTGKDYAGGEGLWRMYFDTHEQKENQILGSRQRPVVTRKGDTITLTYDQLSLNGQTVNMKVVLNVILEAEMVRFTSELENNEPHTIIRELHYPLVGNLALPEGYKLLITDTGGQVFDNPKEDILKRSNTSPYKTPAQLFRQFDVKYPTRIAANCFALFSETDGLYFGSHDTTFQDTYHGLRLYPDAQGNFSRLECGFYKYPNCFYGEKWSCKANVIAPYKGDWRVTSRMYRTWANTWYEKRVPPVWIQNMKSWQRVIFKHQYGEYLFHYTDLYGRMESVGKSVGADAVFTFGWWQSGMDNGYPNYVADPAQGGDEGWKAAIAKFNESGDHIICYFNGKLIDRESDFFKNGEGKNICYRDNTGSEYIEQYKFTGEGTFLGEYNARSFAIADTRSQVWKNMLLGWADRAYNYGADAVFYDQLGYGERATNWDLSREFPVPNLCVVADKAATLKMLRDHINAKNPQFGIGTEWLEDVTSQYCDFTHIYSTTAGPDSFIDWFRYTFPEQIISDREIRDDSDIERRVNNTILKGLRNDIEIYRCRDLIDKTPHYQAYLAQVNALKAKYADVLLRGRFSFMDFFTCSNADIDARCFVNGDRMAIVATQVLKKPSVIEGTLNVPGYRFVESSTLGHASVGADGRSLTLGQYDLAVLLFEKVR